MLSPPLLLSLAVEVEEIVHGFAHPGAQYAWRESCVRVQHGVDNKVAEDEGDELARSFSIGGAAQLVRAQIVAEQTVTALHAIEPQPLRKIGEAVIAGINAVKDQGKNIVLICGGSDKKVDLTSFVKALNNNCKFVSLIPGTGTDVLVNNCKVKVPNIIGKDLKAKSTKSRSLDTFTVFREVVMNAIAESKRGDVILFSPGFASFGMFNNEYERYDLFMKIIKKLK